ncbi:MAG: tetratricopeptide repeat protein [Armatimonadota bacterium]|nr:tetratricopeptide repeat protein [Armatimonadota bacterium]
MRETMLCGKGLRNSLRCREVRVGVVLLGLVLVVFLQTAGFDFVNFDDDVYVENNPAVQAGLNRQTVLWALTTNYQANWHPLTWISLMVDTEAAKLAGWLFDLSLGRSNSGFYHLSNVLFHAANTVLLFVVLNAMTGALWKSAFVAALFGVHPLHIESVAWISERKDVLSTLFWLFTMLAYVRYARTGTRKDYWAVLILYAVGLTAKPMLVSLPIVLCLLDLWPLRRLQLERQGACGAAAPLLKEKSPLFVLAAASCVVTLWAQKSGGAVARLDVYPFGVRLANAFVSYAAYLLKTVWPANLSVLYLHPGRNLPIWQVLCSGIFLFLATAAAVRLARSRQYATVGWFWYLVTLIPVIGLVQVGKQAMADRYTYVPIIGIFILVAWGVPEVLAVRSDRVERLSRLCLSAAAVVVVLVMVLTSYRAVGVWRSSISLFTQALKVDPTNALAYNNLGNALVDLGEFSRAIDCYHKALRYRPEYADARYNLAEAYRQSGAIDKAITEYKRVIAMYPRYIKARNNLGSVYALQGKYDLAIEQFRAVLRIDPQNASARSNLKNVLRAKALGL